MATFYIEAIENTNIALVMVGSPTIGTVKYGVNDTTCPNTYTVTTASTPISLTAGQKCYWTITSTSENFTPTNYLKFTSTAKINVGGNISDLIGGETQIPRSYCFFRLFEGCSTLIDASSLVFVNDFNSKINCYNGMFRECSSLIAIPDLLATTLTSSCYQYMFYNCSSLTVLPELPATTLANNCYNYMFFNCRNIKLSETQTAPYSIPYRIPSEGTGTEGTSSLNNMFGNTGGTFTGTPTINTTYYTIKTQTNVQLYDDDIKLYPITKAENVSGLNDMISGAIADQKGMANGVASLGSDGKVPSGQLPAMDYIPTSQKGAANGVASLGNDGKVPSGQLPAMDYIPISQKGAASGVASLGSDGKVPTSQIPSLSYIPTSQKGVANGVVSLGADGKVLISQLPIYDGTVI